MAVVCPKSTAGLLVFHTKFDRKQSLRDWREMQIYSTSHNTGTDNTKVDDISNSMRSDLSEANSHMQSAQSSYSLAYQEHEAATFAENHDFSMNKNMMAEFESNLRSEYGSQQADYWLSDTSHQNDPKFLEAQSNFVKQNEQVYLNKTMSCKMVLNLKLFQR